MVSRDLRSDYTLIMLRPESHFLGEAAKLFSGTASLSAKRESNNDGQLPQKATVDDKS